MQENYLKQARLVVRILGFLDYQDALGLPLFALKGGTAINYFVQPFPRLSVDIDLTYCPINDRDTALTSMRSGLLRLADKLMSVIPGATAQHKRSTGGDKLFVELEGTLVKIEPNGVLRGTMYPTEYRALCIEAQKALGTIVEVRILSHADLYGGKMCAALDRQHPRDLFDMLPLLSAGALPDTIRKAFLVYAISHPRPLAELFAPNPQPLAKLFEDEFTGMVFKPTVVTIAQLEEARERLFAAVREELTDNERHFLLSVKQGEPDWSLPDLPNHVPQLPGVRWKLHNIDKLRQSPQKHKAALAKLKDCLGL
jgi:predicted nucleotidyltransferase component of viral defense system